MKLAYLFVSVVFVLIPTSAARPMTSLLAEQLDATMLQIGMLTSCYSLLPLVLAIKTGQLVDRFGEKVPLMIGAAGIAVSLFLAFLNPMLPVLFVSQLFLGGSQLFALVAIQNGVAGSSSPATRDRAMGNFSLIVSLGMLLGPLIGGYATEHLGFQSAYFLLSCFSLVTLIISCFLSPSKKKNSQPSNDQAASSHQLLTLPKLRRPIFVSMLNLAALDIFFVYFPLLAYSVGMSPSEIGWILAIQGCSNAMVRFFMPRLVEKYGRIHVLWVFMSIGAAAYGIIPFFHHFLLIAMTVGFIGMGLGVAQPLTLVLTYNAAPSGRTAEALGLRLAGNRLAQVIMPFVFAGLSNFTGMGAIFTLQAGILGMGAWVAKGIQPDDRVYQRIQEQKDAK